MEKGSSVNFTISLGAEESKAETEAGTYTIANPFTEGSQSGSLKVLAVDSKANKTTIYENNVSYSIFYSLGGSIKVTDVVRFERGEGIEKKEENFADEIANMIK